MTAAKRDESRNFYASDVNLQLILRDRAPEAQKRWDAHLSDFGRWVAEDVDAAADYTDRVARPVLETYDRDGAIANHIRHNPGWDRVAREVYERGIVGLNYGDDPAPFLITFAMGYLLAQGDISLHCPVTMTGAVAHVLDRHAPAPIRTRYLHDVTRMDGQALTGGTWATELHGGSDVGGTTTIARRDGDHFRLDGLKWFTSNANGGLALATARPEGAPNGTKGLGLYLVPTHLADGSPNPMRIRRLKDKLGTLGVPTGEIDLTGTWAAEVAPPPDGFLMMMAALEFSRIHNIMAAMGAQRRAFVEARDYAAERVAFGKPIARYPMVQDELLKLLVDLEAGCALAFESAQAFDQAIADDRNAPWLRLVTALAKYRTAEDANFACRAAMEIIGGNAYTRDHVLHRLLRDAQVLTIWEGPANIQALELLRLLGNKHPGFQALEARMQAVLDDVPAALGPAAGTLGRAWAECRDAVSFVLSDPAEAERHARRLMHFMSDVLAAALLLDEARKGLDRGDTRKLLVLRLFLEWHLDPPPRRGIEPGRDWVQTHFDALVAYDAIAP